MLRFRAVGRIGALRRSDELLEVAITCDGGGGAEVCLVACRCADAKLTRRIERTLAVGDLATLVGRIEPRRRIVRDALIYDVAFVITGFRPLRTA